MKILFLALSFLLTLNSFAQAKDEEKIKQIAVDYFNALAKEDFAKAKKLLNKNSYESLEKMQTYLYRTEENTQKHRDFFKDKKIVANEVHYEKGRKEQTVAFVEIEFINLKEKGKSFTKSINHIGITQEQGVWLVDLNEDFFMYIAPDLGR